MTAEYTVILRFCAFFRKNMHKKSANKAHKIIENHTFTDYNIINKCRYNNFALFLYKQRYL